MVDGGLGQVEVQTDTLERAGPAGNRGWESGFAMEGARRERQPEAAGGAGFS